MGEAKQWSREWKSSKNPSKQRKYRSNAPYHHRGRFLSVHLSGKVKDRVGTRSLPVRAGDKVRVMRGDHSGKTGEVDRVDPDEQKVYVNGIDRETVSGSEVEIALRPSNLEITRLNLDDDRRLEKYEVSEEEKEEIMVEEAEEETEEDIEEGEEEPAEEVEDSGEEEEEFEYDEIVQGTIDEVKKTVEEGADPEKTLEAEKENKDRVTLKDWLETRVDGDE